MRLTYPQKLMYSVLHKILKIASVSGAPSQTPLGSLRRSPQIP